MKAACFMGISFFDYRKVLDPKERNAFFERLLRQRKSFCY